MIVVEVSSSFSDIVSSSSRSSSTSSIISIIIDFSNFVFYTRKRKNKLSKWWAFNMMDPLSRRVPQMSCIWVLRGVVYFTVPACLCARASAPMNARLSCQRVQAESCLSVSFMTGLFTILSGALGAADVGANAVWLLTLNHAGTL